MTTFRAAPAFRPLVAIAAVLGLIGAVFFGAAMAMATNKGTQSGVSTEGCNVAWNTTAVMDEDLTNDDAEYPGLMTSVDGTPTDSFVNGGYIKEVNPVLGDPGLFEMNHFYYGSGDTLTQVWRIPTATDSTILDAKVTFTLPTEVKDLKVTFDSTSTNANMVKWGGNYAKYTWASQATAVDNGNGTWTVDLGDLVAGTGTVYQFMVELGGSNFTPADRFVASADLTGTYAPGTNGGKCPITDAPAKPTPTADLEACTAEFLGQTLWSIYDRDITVRDKVTGVDGDDTLGEVNADGWGANIGADGWKSGAERSLRLYAATTQELTNVTYTIDAVQGMTFGNVSTTADTPGAGQLQKNGYTAPVEGVTITKVSDTQIVVTIERMPANSSLSFNATAVLDGSEQTLALNHRLNGDVAGCEQPEPTTESKIVDEVPNCEDKTVTVKTETATTTYVWNPSTLKFDEKTTTEVTESVRPMTEDEVAECPTPSPTDTPTDTDTATPTVVPTTTDTDAPKPSDSAKPTPVKPIDTDKPGSGLATTGDEGVPALAAISAALMLAGAGMLTLVRRRQA